MTNGGYFEDHQYYVWGIAQSITWLIAHNDQEMGHHYPPDIIAKFYEAEYTLRLAATMAHRIDWLVSGVDGEDAFRSRWTEELDELREEELKCVKSETYDYICANCRKQYDAIDIDSPCPHCGQ